MKIRVKFRLYKNGALVREEPYTLSEAELEDFLPKLAERHGAELAAHPHMIEIEFPDEPDPLERFFRFGCRP